MAHIENASYMSQAQMRALLAELPNHLLQAQELTQKGALHALQELDRRGCSQTTLDDMARGCRTLGALISAECKRRGLTVVDVGDG